MAYLYKISDIEKIYPNWYNPDHEFSYDDQKFIWENTPLSPEDEQRLNTVLAQHNDKTKVNEDVSVLNGGVNGGHKQQTNEKLKISKHDAIDKLKTFNFKTPPREIAFYLEVLFGDFKSKEGHWLYIAQKYNPRVINRVINQIIKQHLTGETSKIINPAAYFTFIIKKRKRRRSLRIPMVAVNSSTYRPEKEGVK